MHIVPAAGLGRMLQDAAPADRWTAKLLAYPCFDDGFRQAILSTRLANLQFVLSVKADTSGQFADQVFQWTASSAKDVHEASFVSGTYARAVLAFRSGCRSGIHRLFGVPDGIRSLLEDPSGKISELDRSVPTQTSSRIQKVDPKFVAYLHMHDRFQKRGRI